MCPMVRMMVFLPRMHFFANLLKDDEALKMMLPGFARNLGWFGVMLGKRAMRKAVEKYKAAPGKLCLKVISPFLF